jgi:hypothetical protein
LGTWEVEIRDSMIDGNNALGADVQVGDCMPPGGLAHGGGIYFGSNTSLILYRSILQGNAAMGGDGGRSWDEECMDGIGGIAVGGGICGGGPTSWVHVQNCHIMGNQANGGYGGWGEVSLGYGAGMGQCSGIMINCTMVSNTRTECPDQYCQYIYGVFPEFTGTIINSILSDPFLGEMEAEIVHSLTDPPVVGVGNIAGNPLFVDPINGDYHLKSAAGRWDAGAGVWVKDAVTSPCIDAGDPADTGWMNELWPNGRRIDIGAYGGTAEASMSPNAIGLAADLNFDDRVDIADFAILARGWMKDEPLLTADLTRDGRVGIEDLAAMAEEWMK